MSQIILDFSSGNTCQNNPSIVKRMIDELKAVDTGKHEIIIKWQLFINEGENIPLKYGVFHYAYEYAKELGYKTTASVFDLKSLHWLIFNYDIPFVKIANRRDLDWLIGEIPRKVPVYVSMSENDDYTAYYHSDISSFHPVSNIEALCCVSKYPATIEDYVCHDAEGHLKGFYEMYLKNAISDHTVGMELFKKYQPKIWEKHYRLSDNIGLDAGEFAITPEELAEIL